MSSIGKKTMEVYLPVHKTIVDLLESEGSADLTKVPVLLKEETAQHLAYHENGEDGRVLQVPYDSINTTSGSHFGVALEKFDGTLHKEYVAGISNAERLRDKYFK